MLGIQHKTIYKEIEHDTFWIAEQYTSPVVHWPAAVENTLLGMSRDERSCRQFAVRSLSGKIQ